MGCAPSLDKSSEGGASYRFFKHREDETWRQAKKINQHKDS
jgi:hypothetical protein